MDQSLSNIILIGMPTSGKSTAGVILAKVLGMDFLDTDLLIQKRKKMKLSEIIASEGLDAFLKTEEETCLLLDANTISGSVIATGGSVIYSENAMRHLRRIGTVVYLAIDFETLQKRLHNARKRGVVLREGQTIRELYDERTPLYEMFADLIVQEADLDMEETVHAIIANLSA